MKNKQTNNIKFFQQGDVVGTKLCAMPAGKQKIISKAKCVVAHGESGHSHVVEDDEAELIQIGEKMLLSLTNKATLTHEEHKPITLEPGIWEIGRIQEFDYFQMMSRQVQD